MDPQAGKGKQTSQRDNASDHEDTVLLGISPCKKEAAVPFAIGS
jgi:hypothetical protein